MLNEPKNWITDNIKTVIALSTLYLGFLMFWVLLFGSISKTQENIAFTILGYIIGSLKDINGYYFQSSHKTNTPSENISTVQADISVTATTPSTDDTTAKG